MASSAAMSERLQGQSDQGSCPIQRTCNRQCMSKGTPGCCDMVLAQARRGLGTSNHPAPIRAVTLKGFAHTAAGAGGARDLMFWLDIKKQRRNHGNCLLACDRTRIVLPLEELVYFPQDRQLTQLIARESKLPG